MEGLGRLKYFADQGLLKDTDQVESVRGHLLAEVVNVKI